MIRRGDALERDTRRWRTIVLFVHAMSALAASSCTGEERFIGPSAAAMTPDTPALFASDMDSIFLVEGRLTFPLRAPTNAELEALNRGAQSQNLPFSRLPWLGRYDFDVQLDFTISNLETTDAVATVVLNGISEFHEYVPGVRLDGDDIQVDFAEWERTYALAAGERKNVTVRKEELDEMAVDLATVVNGAPNPNLVVYFENQSDHDIRTMQYIPTVIPGLVGVRFGIRTTEARTLLLEVTVRIVDHESKLESTDEVPWKLPTPTPFTPMPTMAGG